MNAWIWRLAVVALSVGLLACQNAPIKNAPINGDDTSYNSTSADAFSGTSLNETAVKQSAKSDYADNTKPIDFKGKDATPQEAKICQEQGGHIKRVGRAQFQKCIIAYADAGKACQDKTDCQGKCILPKADDSRTDIHANNQVFGVCSADNNPFGCYVAVENGKIGRGLCVD